MVGAEVVFPCQVNRLMTIGLATLEVLPKVHLPGPVSVPNGPMAVGDLKVLLKALAESPLNRIIFDYDPVMSFTKTEFFDGEDDS
jgi:hypothetical protein